MAAPLRGGPIEEAVEVHRLGRGAIRPDLLPPEAIGEGAEGADLLPRALEDRLEEVDHRGLPVGPRDPDDLHPPVRPGVIVSSGAREGSAILRHLDPGRWRRVRCRTGGEDRARSARHRVGHEPVSVQLLPGDGREEVSRFDPAGVIFDSHHRDVGRADDPLHLDVVKDSGEVQGLSSVRVTVQGDPGETWTPGSGLCAPTKGP